MLTKLLKKEFALSMHPTVPLMLLLAAMVLIPNYPYSVISFYSMLSIFFTCMLGRENNDVVYTVGLPVAKADAVRARILFTVLVQLAQLALVALFSLLRAKLGMQANEGGMEANAALLGAGLLLFALFNWCFFTRYYRDVRRVGVSFVIASVLTFVAIAAGEMLEHVVPFIRDRLDTLDAAYRGERLTLLAACAAVYAAATLAALKKSIRLFEKQDL